MSSVLRVKNLSFPWQTQDPFLFCVFHKDNYPAGDENMAPKASLSGRNLGNDFEIKDGWRMYHGTRIPGFPAHPHRGFETVTVVQEGLIDHSDSLGAAGRFGNGDVQWMTAGKGVQHCEMFPMLNQDSGNPTDFFQIWLNLPAKDKLVEPHFAMLWNHEIPIVQENGSSIRIIAGNYNGVQAPAPAPNSWAADRQNDVQIWTINIEAGKQFTIPATETKVNRSLYFFEGDKIEVEGREYSTNKVLELDGDLSTTIQNGAKNARLLFLQGKPIGEPVAQYGPFVMNSQKEIMDAMQEYQETEFGGWPWSSMDNVHAREKGRFALYPDGKEVTP
ncbi:pirin family protein [Portibacter marinus]|uniref:pirin family protein n=1 Tax=Portibacter marinus TaxID=2898660 RepID=UPI001F1D5538|nr:pirin family protein [Portibacter marinus]